MKYFLFLVALLVAWMALSALGSELALSLEVRRAQAESQVLEAQAERDRAAAQLAQAETLREMASAQRAQVQGIMALAVIFTLWSALIGVGGVVLAVVALKGRRAPAPGALPWQVGYPVEILYREEAHHG